MRQEKWTTAYIPDLTGKTIIITGGNSGLGFESAKAFANKGAEVIIACRSLGRGEEAKKQILVQNPKAVIEVMELDLEDLNSIKRFASRFKESYDRLDILMNNAGIMTVPYGLTKDGFERQFGTNHLGHFALTGLLIEIISKTPESRVVNVSSIAHKNGDVDFDNLLYENGRDYTPMKSYRRSKLANLLFTYELQRFFESRGIDSMAVAAHPGVSKTNLVRHIETKFIIRLFRPLLVLIIQSAAIGALAQMRAAVDPDVKGGEYWGAHGYREMSGYPVLVQSNEISRNTETAGKLWEISEKLTGVVYQF